MRQGRSADWLVSAIWSAVICLPLCFFGFYASMALAHGGGPLVLLFAPIFPVMLLFGSGGPFSPVPEWLFGSLAVLAEFTGVFFVVHILRVFFAKRRAP